MRVLYLFAILVFSKIANSQTPYSPIFIDSAKTALKTCQIQKNTTCIIKLQLDIADAYMFIGKPDSTLKFLKNVEQLNSKDLNTLWRFNRLYASYFNNNGIFFTALQYAYKSLHYAEQLNNEEYVAKSYTSLANIHGLLNENEKAIQLHTKAIPIYKKLNISKSIILSINNIGNCYRRMGRFEAAKKNYIQVIDMAKISNEMFWYAVGHSNYGEVLFSQKKYASSIDSYQLAQGVFLKQKDTLSIIQTQNSLAEAYLQNGEIENSEKAALESLALLKNIFQDTEMMKLNQLLFTIYQKKGDFVKAYQFQSEYINLKEKSFENEFDKKLAAQKNEYNLLQEKQITFSQNQTISLQKKNNIYLTFAAIFLMGIIGLTYYFYRNQSKQNEIIKAQNEQISTNNLKLEQQVIERTTELMQANESLITKNAEIENALSEGQKLERDHMASHLHDNLGGYLSALRYNMMALDKVPLPNPKLLENMKGLVNSAYQEIRHLSHNIMPKDLEKEGLVFCLKKLANQLNETGNIKFTYTGIEHLIINQNKEYELYYVCLELTNNILKHSKATEAGYFILQKEDKCTIYIFDNGTGINNASKGFGLENIQKRLGKFNGIIELNTQKPAELADFKTIFTISL